MKFLSELIRPHWLFLYSPAGKLSLFTSTINAIPALINLPFADIRLSALRVSVLNLHFTQYIVVLLFYFIVAMRVAVNVVRVVSFVIECRQRLFDKGVVF